MKNSIKRIQSESLLSTLLSARILREANKAYQYIALAAAAFSFAACTQEDDFTPQGNQKDAPLAIASAGVAELTTRVITDKTELVGTADEYASLGVFITGGSETKYNTNNMKWVHDGMGWTSGETVLFEGAASKQQIAAYSPYNASLYGNTFHIDMDDQSDYLYCEYAPLTSNPAAITMKHLFAKVTVTIPYESFGTSVTNSTVGKVELVNVPVTADWTVPGAELDNYGPSDGEIWLRSEGSTGVFTGYALPNGATSLFLRITMADGNSIYTATVSLDDAETTDETEVLTGGTHYNIGLRVGRDKVDIAHVLIEPWSTGGELEGGVAEEVTLTIDGTLGGKTTATEEDVNALVDQLKAYVDKGNTTIIVPGTEYAMYKSNLGMIPAFAEALYFLTDNSQEESQYRGTIDLILPDATEIIDFSFDSANALKSITLPKVTTVGDGAFYGCQYLGKMTFGSVITEVVEIKSGVFASLGIKSDNQACDLVLNCGQLNAEDKYKPNLESNVWYIGEWSGETEWKSITLTHTGECDECKANQ